MAVPAHLNPARVEIEFSTVWARTYPALFTDKVISIQADYPATEYRHRVDYSRAGFITFTMERKE